MNSANTYVCKRCMYKTDTKTNMRAHLARKRICKVNECNGGQDINVEDLIAELGDIVHRSKSKECPYCMNTYSSSSTLSRHKKVCQGKVAMMASKEFQAAVDNAVDSVLKRLGVDGRGTAQSITNNNNHTNNQTNNITNNITNIITLNAHGKEDLAYLTHDFLTECTKNAYTEGIPKLIREVHLNPEHPENRNVRGKSLRQSMLETYNGKQWIITPAVPVLDSLIQKGCKVIWKHLLDNINGDFLDHNLQDVIQKQLMTLTDVTKERKTETYYKIRNKVFFMFFEESPDDFAVVMEPEGQDEIVETTLLECQNA